MGLQAADQLVTELAAGRVGTDFKPTEVQDELNIPTFLVYLLGIVISEDEYQRWKNEKPATKDGEAESHVSPLGEKRFHVFQKQYFASTIDKVGKPSQLEPKSYKLTTRMFPSKEQQAIIKRDLLVQCEKLESLSNEALESLLLEEESLSQQALTKSKRKKKKKKKKQQPVASGKTATASGEEETTTATKEVVVTTFQNPSTKTADEKSSSAQTKNERQSETENPSSSSNSLVPDGVKNANPNILKDLDEFEESIKDEEMHLTKDICGDSGSPDISDNGSETKLLSSLASEVSHVEQAGSLLDNLMSSLPPIDPSVLTQRISDLEHDLAETKCRAKEERLAHAKALRNEKEKYESLIQALQLRLYISENKVRTYEDALEKHIEAISLINGRGRVAKKINQEERMPSSPSLISRVLEKARVAKNGDV